LHSPPPSAGEFTLDELFQQYSTVLIELLNQHAPFVTIKVKRLHGTPWFDDDCRQQKRAVRRAERHYRKTKHPSDQLVFRSQQIILSRLYKAKESTYWSTVLYQAGNTASSRWKAVNRLMCRSATDRAACPDIPPDQYLDFFINKIDQIRNNTADAGNVLFSSYSGPVFSQFANVPTSDIRKLISTAPSKQCILDPAPTSLVKECADLLAPYITMLVNRSLSEGYLPSSQKVAVIRPLLKKCGLDNTQVSNYRPVSNLSFLSKILERAVDAQLNEFLSSSNALPLNQSAYRKYHSTETALLKIHSDLCSYIDKGEAALLALLDLSAAFDTVDFGILLTHLETSFCITGTVHKWIKSYLHDRTCFVLINDRRSRTVNLVCGVPQGSVLGPKFWLLYIKDLDRLITDEGLHYHGYADDSQIYGHCNVLQAEITQLSYKFTSCISKLIHWMKTNRLQLNPDKTECIWFRSSRCQHDNFPSLQIGDVTVHPVRFAKSLGVYFDQSLSYDRQISAVSKSCYFQLRQLRSVCRRLQPDTIKSVLQAFISTHLDYCNALYSGLPQYRINTLTRIQNHAARLYSGTCVLDHISPVLRELHWLPVAARIDYKIGVFVYKALHNQLPDYLSDLCVQVCQCHEYALRSVTRQDLATMRNATAHYGNRTFQSSAAEVWNSIPKSVRSASTVPAFCRQLKTHLFVKSLS
jgi:hypothetical protein